MKERHISGADLIAELPLVLRDISEIGVTYLVNLGPAGLARRVIRGLVNPAGEAVFALGRPADLRGVFGLVDPEYGWPWPVQIVDIAGLEDVAPSYRRHPMLYLGQVCLAVSVSWREYEQIRSGGPNVDRS